MATQTKTWITDANGNRASVERWGSPEAAQAAFDSESDALADMRALAKVEA